MTFEEVWTFFETLRGRRLNTLDQQRSFTVEQVAPSNLTFRVERTGSVRTIQRADFEDAWQRLMQMGRLSRAEIRRKFSPFIPAYVAALLAQVQGVRYALRPIMLFWWAHRRPLRHRRLRPPQARVRRPPDEDDEPGNEEVEESLADRLAEYGQRAGFEVRKEWRTDTGNRIDLVWARQLPARFPGFRQASCCPSSRSRSSRAAARGSTSRGTSSTSGTSRPRWA